MHRWMVGSLILLLVALGSAACGRAPRSDPALVDLAVRATLHAMPTATPRVVEVTRMVEVTRLIEVTRVIEATPSPTPTATPTETPSPAPAVEPAEAAAPVSAPAVSVSQRIGSQNGCPVASDRQYATVPVAGGGAEHPDHAHGDLNLALRSYEPVAADLAIVDINGPSDGDPPQLAGIFADNRTPAFINAYRVRSWDWTCGARGCAGEPLDRRAVTLLGLAAQPGETVRIPSRNARIYAGDFKALVLYAEERRITLVYTREDSVANGYAVHLEQICVDPNLLSLYQQANAAGRGALPALRNDETLGTASSGEIAVAVRDRGVFFDPRSRKDWWRGR